MLSERIREAMEGYFGTDQRRIDHALQVAGYARQLLDAIPADPQLTLAAAYLHDIGIHEAERRHGSSAGPYQELEGPAVARRLLQPLTRDEAFVASVCELVGHHHTPEAIDSPEFSILWDADALVNLQEVLPGKRPAQVKLILDRSLTTEAGYRLACEVFLPNPDNLHSPIDRQQAS